MRDISTGYPQTGIIYFYQDRCPACIQVNYPTQINIWMGLERSKNLTSSKHFKLNKRLACPSSLLERTFEGN